MVETYFLKVDRNIETEEFDFLLSHVSEEKKERISRFHMFEDAQRTLIGDVLARYAICNRLGIKNNDLVFGTNEYGKPILLGQNGIHFNISHSGNWVVCAVDDNTVGIDVEVIKPIDFKIAESFFSRNEYISLINQQEDIKLKYFYMIWTLKESYIKTEGKGLSIQLNSFAIRIRNNDISVSVDGEIQEFHFYQSFLDSNTVYAVCALNKNTKESIYWSIEDFLKEVHSIVLSL